MKAIPIKNAGLNARILGGVKLTNGKIRRDDMAVTPVISSFNYIEYDDAAGLSPVISALNFIIAAFRGEEPPEPPEPEYWFTVNGQHAGSLKAAIDLLNSSERASNDVRLVKDIDLDVTDGGVSIPAIAKSAVFDFQGHVVATNGTFGASNNGDSRLFCIQLSSGQPDAEVTLKNGAFKSAVSSNAGFLYTESVKNVNLENLSIDWDFTNAGGGYIDVIAYRGSAGATLSGVSCAVVGHNHQGCFEARSRDGKNHPEYEFILDGCRFSQQSIDRTEVYPRQTRTGTVFAGSQVNVSINGGEYTSDNGYCAIGTLGSGASIFVNGNAKVESKSSTGSGIGPAFRIETVNGAAGRVTVNSGSIVQESGEMFVWNDQTGSGFATPAATWILNNGDYDKFGYTGNSAFKSLSVAGGTYSTNVSAYCIEGKTCTYDESIGKYRVHDAKVLPIDPAAISNVCAVGIPSNIVDGTTLVGVDSYDASTGSMTVTEKRVTSFNAKFCPGGHAEAVAHINPTVVFNRCVIATELEIYGDCATVGRPITVEFHNCVFDGQDHAKQFLFMSYGEKYSFVDNNYVVVDQAAVAEYDVVLDNCAFINLSPDKATRALFKGFGSTYDRPDMRPGNHFDQNANALSAQAIAANAKSAALIAAVGDAYKEYKPDHQFNYYSFQAGSNTAVTNI